MVKERDMIFCNLADAKNWMSMVIMFCVIAVTGLTGCSTTQHTGSMLPDNSTADVLKAEKKAEPAIDTEELARLREKQLASEDGVVRPDGHINAMAQRRALLDSSSRLRMAGISKNQWSFIGPGNIGGRIRSIAIHPTNTNTMWLGSVSGGIWTTTDGGASWSPVNDFMGNLSITSIVIDPTNSSTMYAGTGDGIQRGYGVFKSTDGGSTWNQLPSTTPSADKTNSAYGWYYVNRLAISSSGVILASTGSLSDKAAIYRSADGGSTWTNTFTGSTFDARFDPNNPNNAVAHSGDYYSNNILRSTDAGQTWTKVKTVTQMSRSIAFAYAMSNPQIIYASYNNNSGEIYKSADGGITWTLLSNPKHLGNQGDSFNTIWVSPTNPDFVVVGGLDLYRSTNGGSTWEQISTWMESPPSAHADHLVIVSPPGFDGTSNKTVFVGNDGGIYKANDISANTVSQYDNSQPSITWTNLNNSLGITQFYGGAGSSSAGKIIGGTQDNGQLMTKDITGTTWKATKGGDGGFVAVDPNDSNYMYGESLALNVYRSTDGGETYKDICKGITEAQQYACGGNGSAAFTAPFILDPNNSNTMLGGAPSLWRSTDVKAATPSWSSIKAPIGKAANEEDKKVSAIAVAPGNSDIIWAGYDSGEVYYTTNGTAAAPAWTLVSTALPARYVMRIMVDKDNSNKVYVTFGGFEQNNLYLTTDSGTAWTSLNASGTIPSAPIRTIVRHNSNPNWLYIGTEVGIFTSEDGGTSWSTTNDGPANVPVHELSWYGSDKLLAATYGRSMFLATVSGGSQNNCAATLSDSFLLHEPYFKISESYLSLDLQYAQDAQFPSTDIMFKLSNYKGVSTPSDYSNCKASDLSVKDNKYVLRIPIIILGGTSYWLDLTYVPTTDGLLWFKLTGFGVN